jgi:hypothetical protein
MSGELENTMRSRLFSLFFPVWLALAAPAFAHETLDSILPQIRAAHPGRLSDAEPFIGNDGRAHYRIKWMTPEGRILYFDADAQTGRYSNFGGDNGGQWRGGGDNHGYEGEHRRSRDNWNGGGPDNGGPDWRDHENGGPPPGGDWGDRRGPPPDWGGRGDWGHGGGWRGGRGGGNNGWGHGHGGH